MKAVEDKIEIPEGYVMLRSGILLPEDSSAVKKLVADYLAKKAKLAAAKKAREKNGGMFVVRGFAPVN